MPTLRTDSARILTMRKVFGALPAWRCWSKSKGLFYLCGHCFGMRGSGPATNAEEIWKPGLDGEGKLHPEVVPHNARCEQCGGRAWPKD